ncbi:MAG: Txe/YoeB family addiction module toxin [Flavobacteriales bacterium]|nr:Txe/YoeB family addiction module toxin [Flavobacteriales bacterium]
MKYRLDYTEKTKKDIDFFKKSGNLNLIKKIFNLLNEISEHPYTGIGKPEPLKYQLSGYWSRRINKEHRIIYEFLENENIVVIHSLKGHYN